MGEQKVKDDKEKSTEQKQTYPITRRLPNGQYKDESTGEVSWPTTRNLNEDPFINIGGGGR